ncbi:hypothetical protein P280DRAFT_467009 [Massarina eburnea CBS 473.64]|uniref:Uncharacterized protein n=1 Tax=Massarina eburnea CBS 473.64 TaxID=1395130 RepID=A0A6A6S9G1_9PLEO|nr:hypothetical protein P280DRAFT_467009 [Massarina eburnea CBS 473.64]
MPLQKPLRSPRNLCVGASQVDLSPARPNNPHADPSTQPSLIPTPVYHRRHNSLGLTVPSHLRANCPKQQQSSSASNTVGKNPPIDFSTPCYATPSSRVVQRVCKRFREEV